MLTRANFSIKQHQIHIALSMLISVGLFIFLLGNGAPARASLTDNTPQTQPVSEQASPTPTPCPAGSDYVFTRSTGATIVPGTTSIGINCQFNCVASISLPFPFTLYDQTFTTATVGSNGILGFIANSNPYTPACLPSSSFNYAIAPDWEQMVYRYSNAPRPDSPGAGVFTSITGTPPNRIFNIEWRARDNFNVSPINFEIRLYENSPNGRFDMVYGSVNHHGGHAVVGVQRDTGSRYTQFSCLRQGQIEAGVQLTFTQGKCGTPVPPTITPTRSLTPLPTNTSIPTATRPPTSTSIPSPTSCVPSNTNYVITQSTGSTIVPGVTDTGMHCSECSTTINLPFPFTLYDRTFTNAIITSKGTLGFINVTGAYWSDCLPDQYSNYAIFPHWDDLDVSSTCGNGNCGVYTSITGQAPNRIFNIEWRARYHNLWNTLNFEVRLYEGQKRFDLIYGYVTLQGYNATVGVQRDAGSLYTQFSCWGYVLPQGLQLAFQLPSCNTAPPPITNQSNTPTSSLALQTATPLPY